MSEISILIVEDDFIVAKVIEKSLREMGYHIAGMVSNGNDAVAIADKEPVDLVLMDINLQGDIDGIVTADAIRSRQDIPVVFLTAFSDQKTFSRALETAPYGYITKPFQTATLATTIQVALNKHRLDEQQELRSQWLEGTLRSFSEGIITVDSQANIILMNPVAEHMTGWTAKEAQGQSISRVLQFENPLLNKRGTIATKPVVTEGIVTTVPDGSFIIAKDGVRSPVGEAIASPVRDESGTIAGAAVVIYPRESSRTSPEPDTTSRSSITQSATIPAPGKTTSPGKRRQPVTANNWIDRGNTLVFMRRYDDAIKAYDRAIAMSPTNYQAWYGKGTALSKTGKLDDALLAYDQALAIHPRNHQILIAKGVLLKKIGNDEEADRCFELAHLYSP